MVRAFLAFEMSVEVRQRLAEEMQTLRRRMPDARWVKPSGLHLTLKFLGETSQDVLDAVTAELAPLVGTLDAVPVQLAGAGFFPSRTRPRVAWVGGEARGALEVARTVEEVASKNGFEREGRPWSLHLTLARLRTPWPARDVAAFEEWGQRLELAPFVCTEVVLFSSDLQPSGAVYTALQRMRLRS